MQNKLRVTDLAPETKTLRHLHPEPYNPGPLIPEPHNNRPKP